MAGDGDLPHVVRARPLYFLADHDSNRRRNVWAYELGGGQFRQVTHFTDYDIDFPSLGAGSEAGIVFQQGGKLHVLDICGLPSNFTTWK